MKVKKTCSNCIRGTRISINKDILCREKGVVSPDYVCFRHRFMPENNAATITASKCIDCENFIVEFINSNNPSTIGLCQLFSVRQFDGSQKKACSKFVRRTDLEVG